MTADEVVALAKRHTLFEWSAQSALQPLAVSRADGVHFWTADGARLLDFNSQSMCVNVGHGNRHIIDAISRQLTSVAFVSPFMTTEARALLGSRLAVVTPGDIDVFFFTTAGTEANEHAVRIARAVTGRRKVLAQYRSYHGATTGSLALSGDPRRWHAGSDVAAVVHVLHPYRGPDRGWDSTDDALARLEETIQHEGLETFAAFILEPVAGSNGILVPPDDYLRGVRELCTKYGILMICDEIMSGFGRTGEWFAVDHWRVVPDILTMAKGLTSGYVPLGAIGVRRSVAAAFADRALNCGLTYNSHPVACAAALATLDVYRECGLIENARAMGAVMRSLACTLQERHECVGAVRSIGLFGLIELVRSRDPYVPLAAYATTSPAMTLLGRLLHERGLYTMVRWNWLFTNPPLCITEDQLREGFAIIDDALTSLERSQDF
ncbi:MAG TPA: aminotransferase class III-fold pyridoxal phosphate-dependent enzyme [Vicinamibacterales bacterium]|nr:aminotransferase class III-fold pyridoxal phosphate-dependent enzyme [Vicinamibacterales bacterium]